jgi:hypothetical protein
MSVLTRMNEPDHLRATTPVISKDPFPIDMSKREETGHRLDASRKQAMSHERDCRTEETIRNPRLGETSLEIRRQHEWNGYSTSLSSLAKNFCQGISLQRLCSTNELSCSDERARPLDSRIANLFKSSVSMEVKELHSMSRRRDCAT